MVDKDYGEKFEYLRKKAEQVLLEKKGISKKLPREMDELIHELEVHQIELEMQNQDLIETQEKLEDSRRDYYELYDFAPVGYLSLDEKGLIKRINFSGAKMLGKPRKFIVNNPFTSFIAPYYRKAIFDHFKEIKESQLKGQCQVELLSAQEKPVFVSLDTITFLDKYGNFKEFRSTLTDITGSKKLEQELISSLKEKELLLKEIHHRVKNDLQIISSLLSLQSEYISNENYQEFFHESQNRAKSMALIHERLYQSSDLNSIDFAEYIRTIIKDLYRTYGINSANIKLKMDLQSIYLDITAAIPCGLIINELISNAMKHAFPQDQKGVLSVKFYKEDKDIILIVEDTGVGFPEDIDFKKTDSLGLNLVNTLVNQINGEISMNTNNGTQFKIKFRPEFK